MPTPTFERNPIYPAPLTVYGRLSVGVVQSDGLQPAAGVAVRGIGSLERSHIGFTGTETLDRGLLAHVQIEHSLNVDGGTAARQERFFDARATVGLSNKAWGRVDLGLLDQPAWQLVLAADPWGGNTVATPGRRAYLPPANGLTRSQDAVTYSTPSQWDWHLAMQVGKPDDVAGAAHRAGFSLSWARAPWMVGLGAQSWGDGFRSVPVVVVHDTGVLSVAAAYSRADSPGTRSRNLFVGASGKVMAIGDPQRHEWRVGVDRFDQGPDRDIETKLSVGWRYRMSPRVVVLANMAVTQGPQGQRARAFDLGLSYSFARDLRFPQVPR